MTDFAAAYTNGRKTTGNEIYDKAGNIVDKTTSSNIYDRWKFDASGRNVETVMRWYQSVPTPTRDSTQTIAKTFDDDGLDVKRVDTEDWFSTFPTSNSGTVVKTEYYIRSSVLKGQILTKLDGTGAKKVTNVYTGSGVLAEQRVMSGTSGVYWRHEDLVTGSYAKIAANGQYGGHADDSPMGVEYDPLGGAIEPTDPNYPDLVPADLEQFRWGGDNNRPEMCMWNGAPMPCSGLKHVTRDARQVEYHVNTRRDGGYDLYYGLRSGQLRRRDVYKDDEGNDKSKDGPDEIIRIASATRYQYSYYELLAPFSGADASQSEDCGKPGQPPCPKKPKEAAQSHRVPMKFCRNTNSLEMIQVPLR